MYGGGEWVWLMCLNKRLVLTVLRRWFVRGDQHGMSEQENDNDVQMGVLEGRVSAQQEVGF